MRNPFQFVEHIHDATAEGCEAILDSGWNFGEGFLRKDAEVYKQHQALGEYLGGVELEVSQPQPCWKLARRLRVKEAPTQVVKTGRTGWYLGVRMTGELAVGAEMILKERPNPAWTIARAIDVVHSGKYDSDSWSELAAFPGLSKSWGDGLRSRS